MRPAVAVPLLDTEALLSYGKPSDGDFFNMGLRQIRRRHQQKREVARQRFRKQKNANLLAKPGIHEFIVVLDNLKPGYNIGKIFRSADAFGAREVHLIGIDFFDPSPAMGSFKWVPARFHPDFENCYQNISSRGYTLFTLDPAEAPVLPETPLPRKSAFILGHEEYGHSFNSSAYPGIQTLSIPQFGKVESLNVSVAASIVMYEYLRQHLESFKENPRPDYRYRDIRELRRQKHAKKGKETGAGGGHPKS